MDVVAEEFCCHHSAFSFSSPYIQYSTETARKREPLEVIGGESVRQTDETLLGKVFIEGKNVSETQLAHEKKAAAIHQAKLAALC